MSITEQNAKHIGLIFCECGFLRLIGAGPCIDEDKFIAYLQFFGPFLDDLVIRLIVDEVGVLGRGTQRGIFSLDGERLLRCFCKGFDNLGGCFLQRFEINASYLVALDDLGNVFVRAIRHLNMMPGWLAAADVHHSNHHSIGLIANRRLPYLEAQVLRLDVFEFRLALGGVALHVFQDSTFLIQVRQGTFLAYVGETHSLGLEFLLAFLFEVGQSQVLKDHGRQFLHSDFGLVVVIAGIFAGIALFVAFAWPGFLGDDIANFALAIALACMLLAARVIAKTVFFQGANGYSHHLLTIGEDDAFLANNIAQVFLDCFANLLFMTFLVDLSFAVQ